MKVIKEIEIVFENCDCVKIPANAIDHFMMSGITQSSYMSYSSSGKVISLSNNAEKCAFYINLNEANHIHVEWPSRNIPVQSRIQDYSDITHYYIHYEDGSQYCVRPPWEGGQFKNELQVSECFLREKKRSGDSEQILLINHGYEFEDDSEE